MDLIRKGSSVERGQTAKWKQVELLDLSDLSDLSELVRLVRLFPTLIWDRVTFYNQKFSGSETDGRTDFEKRYDGTWQKLAKQFLSFQFESLVVAVARRLFQSNAQDHFKHCVL